MKKIAMICLCGLLLLCFPAKLHAAELAIPARSYGGGTFIGYTVQPGDNLYRISESYGFDAKTLACINNIANPRLLSIGQEILIPTENDACYQVMGQESLSEVAELYGVDPMEIALANDIWDMEALPVGASLTIPNISPILSVNSLITSRSAASFFLHPVEGVISSGYGYRHGEFHTGLDIAVPTGTAVKAAMAGTVLSAGWDGNYGYAVVIDHHNGYKTRYAHNSAVQVQAGQRVQRGQTVAISGSTGRSTGPHVHWEIIKDGQTQDPRQFY